MTISTTNTSVQAQGNGLTTVFNFPFKLPSADDLIVGQIVNGAYTEILTGFSVSGIDDDGGGAVNFAAAPANGVTVDLRLDVAPLQPARIGNFGKFLPNVHEEAFDRTIEAVQTLRRQAYEFGIHGPDTESVTWPALPDAATRAGAALLFDSSGLPSVGILSSTPITKNVVLGLLRDFGYLYQISPAETSLGFVSGDLTFGYLVGDVRRYGVVPNSAGAASSNTSALKKFLNPASSGYTGEVVFPPQLGGDIYYFNDVMGVRDGLDLNLSGTTINFTKNGIASDSQCGFFHAIRNVTIRDGSIIVNYTQGAGTNTGNAIGLGGRGADVSLFPPIYDSLLPSPMGNITLRNLYISVASAQARGVFALGGLQRVTIDNVWVEGNGTCSDCMYGEFGWATNEANEYQRQTSHPNAWKVTNWKGTNSLGLSFGINGCYGIEMDNIRGYTVGQVLAFGAGESMYYRPWSGQDGAGTKHTISIRNVFGTPTGLGIGITGTGNIASSYLNGPGANNPNGLSVANQTDLIEALIENVALNGTVNNYGISSTGAVTRISNFYLANFQRGIVIGQECTQIDVSNGRIFDSTDSGMVIGQAVNTRYSPARQSTGSVRNVFIAGSGTAASAGSKGALVVATTTQLMIEVCRFGYETIHDNKAEASQGIGVNVQADAFGVLVRNCYGAGIAGGANMYNLASALSSSRGCRLEGNSGIVSTAGIWASDLMSTTAPSIGNGATIVTSAVGTARVTNAGAVTGAIVQAGAYNGQPLNIINEGSNSITCAAAGTSNVANGTSCVIAANTAKRLIWDAAQSLWYPAQ